eukprot:4708486-Amphidinium_carterae.1
MLGIWGLLGMEYLARVVTDAFPRTVSRAWRQLSVEAPTAEALWQRDVGKARRAAAWKAP